MYNLYLILIVIFAIAPIFLLGKSCVNKQIFIAGYLYLTLKPLSFIIIPFLLNESLQADYLNAYLRLHFLYYVLLTLMIWLMSRYIRVHGRKVDKVKIEINDFRYIFIGVLIVSFLVLVITSGGTFLTDPRYAYQHHRSGVGLFWILLISFSGILFVHYSHKGDRLKYSVVFLFALLAAMSGSKHVLVVYFLCVFFVLTTRGIRISMSYYLIGGSSLILLLLLNFGQLGADENFLLRVGRYYNALDLAKLVFQDYESGQLEFKYGEIFTSSFWSYVPRGLYPEKPFAYGPILVLEDYFPGMAATGHTPSFGPLTTDFVDFWYFAPLVNILTELKVSIYLFGLLTLSYGKFLSKSLFVMASFVVLAPAFGFHMPLIIFLLLIVLLSKVSRVTE